MAISYVDHVSAGANTATMPTHQQGDLLIVFAYRNTTTAPSLPSGWTNIANGSGNSNSYRIGYKIAASTSDAFGTWTNANVVHGIIYRGARGIGASSGATKAASTTANIPALTLQDTSGASWVLAMAGSRQTSAQGTPAAGATTSRGTQAGTTSNAIAADTNGGVSSFSATTSSNNTSVTSSGASVEILVDNALAETLTDNFDDNSLSASWNSYADAGVTTSEANQEIEIAIAGVAGYGGIDSAAEYSLYGSSVYAQLKDAGNQALEMDVLPVLIRNAAGNNALMWIVGGNTLVARAVINAVDTDHRSDTTYDSAVHKWFRIREASGTIYWDYSTDGSSWTNYTSIATSTFTFGLHELMLSLETGIWGTAGTTTTKFDNFNVAPSAPGGAGISTLLMMGVG